jgi:hypothetical protein
MNLACYNASTISFHFQTQSGLFLHLHLPRRRPALSALCGQGLVRLAARQQRHVVPGRWRGGIRAVCHASHAPREAEAATQTGPGTVYHRGTGKQTSLLHLYVILNYLSTFDSVDEESIKVE